VRLPRLSPSGFRMLVLVTLVSLVAITVVGAGVRLTGSGLGCSTWPNCEPDSFAPRSASDGHAMVEFANRLLNAAVGLLAIATVVGALRRSPRRPDLVRWSWGVFAWVASNGLVGAVVVWLHLSPVSVIAHFALALGAVWNALLLLQRAGEPDDVHGIGDRAADSTDPSAPAARRRVEATPVFVAATRVLLGAAVLVLTTGTLVTGSGPHAGDEEADRLGLDVGTVARTHGLTMFLFLATTLVLVRLAHRGDAGPRVTQRLHELLVVLVAQAALGYWQYFSGIPALLVAFHVLGATLVWIAVLRVWLSLRAPAGAERPDGVAAGSGAPLAHQTP
jgi:cytochrome c oxidase assembly protein subunit 15